MSPIEHRFRLMQDTIDAMKRQIGVLWPPRKRQSSDSATGGAEIVALTGSVASDGTATVKAAITYSFTTADGASHSAIAAANQRPYGALLKAGYGDWITPVTGSPYLLVRDEVPDTATCSSSSTPSSSFGY